MNPDRWDAWQAAMYWRDQAMIAFAVVVAVWVLVYLAWGRETEIRRRLCLEAWWACVLGFAAVGLWAG